MNNAAGCQSGKQISIGLHHGFEMIGSGAGSGIIRVGVHKIISRRQKCNGQQTRVDIDIIGYGGRQGSKLEKTGTARFQRHRNLKRIRVLRVVAVQVIHPCQF